MVNLRLELDNLEHSEHFLDISHGQVAERFAVRHEYLEDPLHLRQINVVR